MKNKIICTVFAVFLAVIVSNFTYAASAKITASKTSVTVGESVTVTVTINAAAWNVKPSGAISGGVLAGVNNDGENQTTTETYKLDTSKAGTYTVSITGDVTDADETFIDVNSSITVVVKEKPVNTNTGTGTGNSNNNTTPVTKSSDATLKALKVDVEGLNPTFNKNTYIYTLSISSEVNSLKVTASTNHSKAKYSVTGNTNLKNGDNNVLITVTAENGSTKTYKIIVTKAEDPQKANAYLTNIVLDNATLNEEFVRETMDYTVANVTHDVTKLQISAFPENSKATVKIEGNDELKVGENIIKILVTAEDGRTTKAYTIKLNRDEQPKNNIQQEEDEVIEQNNLTRTENNSIWGRIVSDSETQLIIIIYLLALVEFFEIVYLFVQIKDNKKSNLIDDLKYNKRRKDKKDNEK